MASHVVRKGSIYRYGVVLKNKNYPILTYSTLAKWSPKEPNVIDDLQCPVGTINAQ
jgi:hypothetical protein